MNETRVDCPECKGSLIVGEHSDNQIIRCSVCGKMITIEDRTAMRQGQRDPTRADTDADTSRMAETVSEMAAADSSRSESSDANSPGATIDYFTADSNDQSHSKSAELGQHNIPGYEIMEVLGRGGMGMVYKARQRNVNRLVALKTVLGGVHAQPEELARLRLEAEVIGRFQHPNIVQVFDVGEADGCLYFSLEYVDGGTLGAQLDGTPLDAREAASLIQSLASAIDYAHKQGIVHRDLKPANILLTLEDSQQKDDSENSFAVLKGSFVVLKITDFGLAKLLESDDGRTRTGAFLGTPTYASPEQAMGNARHVGPGSDIYALGAILYELLTGRPPFRGATLLDTLEQVRHQEPVAPTMLNPAIGRDLETICLKCLRKTPAERYDSAQELADDLNRFLANEPIQARPVGNVERAVKWCRRRPAIAGLTAMVVFSLVTGTIVSTLFGMHASDKAAFAERKANDARVAEGRERDAKQDAEQKAKEALAAESRERDAKKDAEKQAEEARRAEAAARGAEKKERAASETAKREQTKAENLAAELKTALERVQEELDKSRFVAYSFQFGIADSLARSGNIQQARDALYRTPPELRGWETTHLQRNMQRVITDAVAHDGPVRAIACSPQGDYFATAGADKTIKLWAIDRTQKRIVWSRKQEVLPTWDSKSFQQTGTLTGHTGEVLCLAISDDGEQIYSGSADKTIRVWNRGDGKTLHTLAGHKGSVTCLGVTRDSKQLLSGSEDKSVHRWDVDSGKSVASYAAHEGAIRAISVSQIEDRFVTAGEDGSLKVWDLANGKVLHTLRGHEGAVTSAMIPPGTQRVLSIGTDKTLRIWHMTAGAEVGSIASKEPSTFLMAADDTGNIATHEQGTIQIWNPTSGADSVTMGDGRTVPKTAAMHTSGDLLLAGYESGMIVLWDTKAVPGVHEIAGKKAQRVVKVQFSPNGRYLAATNVHDPSSDIIDVETGRTIQHLDRRTFDSITAMAFSHDGKYLFAGGPGKTGIRLWDWRAKKLIRQYDGHYRDVSSLTLSPDGNRLVSSGSNDTTAIVRDVRTGIVLHRFGGHKFRVLDTAFSADSKYIATAADGGQVKIWEAASGKELHAMQAHPRATNMAVFNRASDRLLTCGFNKGIKEWDIGSGKLTRVFHGHTSSADGLGFSADGRQLFSLGNDRTLRVWDYETGQQAAVIPSLTNSTSFAVSPDGKRMAMGTYDCKVRIWLTHQDDAVRTLRPATGAVWAAAWSPDGKRVASAGEDTTISIWDPQSGDATDKLKGHTIGLLSLAYHPDGKKLLSTAQAGSAMIWDLESGKPVRNLKQRDHSWGELWSVDGKRHLSWGGKYVNIWSTETEKETAKLVYSSTGREFLNGALLTPDNKWIVICKDRPMKVCILDARSGKIHATVPGGFPWLRGMAVSPDSKLLVVVDGNRLKLWDIESGKEIRQLAGEGAGWGVTFSNDGKWIASGGYNSTVRVWEVATGKQVHVFRGHTQHIFDVAFRPDDQQILSCSEDETIKIWNWPPSDHVAATAVEPTQPQPKAKPKLKGKPARLAKEHQPSGLVRTYAFGSDGVAVLAGEINSASIYRKGHQSFVLPYKPRTNGPYVHCISYCSTHDSAALGATDGAVHWWSGLSKGAKRIVGKHKGRVFSVAFDSDGSRIVSTGEDRLAQVWDVEKTDAPPIVKLEHVTPVFSARFSPDGKHVVTGSTDSLVRIWNAHDGKLLRTLKGHADGVSRVDYSPDGKRIVSVSLSGNNVRVWNAQSGEQLTIFQGHDAAASCASFSADGKRVASGDFAGVGKVWDASTGEELYELKGPKAKLMEIQFLPDSDQVRTAASDKKVRHWELNPKE